jgi:hypothetical protein
LLYATFLGNFLVSSFVFCFLGEDLVFSFIGDLSFFAPARVVALPCDGALVALESGTAPTTPAASSTGVSKSLMSVHYKKPVFFVMFSKNVYVNMDIYI